MVENTNIIRISWRKNVSLKKALFFSGLFFWIMQEYIMRTKFLSFFGYGFCTIIRITALLLMVLKIILLDTRYTPRTFFLSVLFCIVAIVSQVSANAESSNTMINVFIICMASRGIEFSEICYFTFWISGGTWSFIVLSPYLGIVENDYIRESFRVRYYLGFDYVGFPSIYLINIIFAGFYAYTYKNRKSVPLILIVVAAFVNQWTYQKTNTRLGYIISLLFLALYILVEKMDFNIFKNCKMTRVLAMLIFPMAGILTYVISNIYNSSDVKWIAANKLLSNRLLMNKIGIERYGITLFGQVISSNTNMQSADYFFIDSGYMSLLLRNGLVVFSLVLLTYVFMLRSSIETNNTILAIWLVCVSIYCIANGILLSPVTNCSLLAIWQIKDSVVDMKTRVINRIKSNRGGGDLACF